MGELQPKDKISSNRCPSPLTAVGLYHPAAGGDLDLRASLCAIHLVLQCWEWIERVCVLLFAAVDYCMPGPWAGTTT